MTPLVFLTRLPTACTILFITSCQSWPSFPPGGYSYPKQVAGKDTDFYLYPLRDSLSKLDSFNHIWDNYAFQELDEPNLSLHPSKIPEFRFFQPGYRSYDDLIILLTPASITVKRHPADHFRLTADSNRLSPSERRFVKFMERYYGKPRPDSIRWPRWHHFIDSMEDRYPQLKDASYYVRMIKKELIPDSTFTACHVSTRHITSSEYQSFVDSLNVSGYWKMPYKRECDKNLTTDGPSYFSLEANTPNRYNFVCGYSCPNDTNLFYKACQHLARLAGLEKEINVLWIEGSPDTTRHKIPMVVDDVILEDVKEPQQTPPP